jgi:hypothetical protein
VAEQLRVSSLPTLFSRRSTPPFESTARKVRSSGSLRLSTDAEEDPHRRVTEAWENCGGDVGGSPVRSSRKYSPSVCVVGAATQQLAQIDH